MPKYYLLDENKNLVEGFDKEGFLALLQQAIDQGSLENIDPESAVASKLRSLVNGTTHHIEFVTEAQYNQLEHDGELVPNTYYFITDDTTFEGYEETLNDLVEQLDEIMEGSVAVPKAVKAEETSFTNEDYSSVTIGSNDVVLPLDKNKNYLIMVIMQIDLGYGMKETKVFDLGVIGSFPTNGIDTSYLSNGFYRLLGRIVASVSGFSYFDFSLAYVPSQVGGSDFKYYLHLSADTTIPANFFNNKIVKLFYKEVK